MTDLGKGGGWMPIFWSVLAIAGFLTTQWTVGYELQPIRAMKLWNHGLEHRHNLG